MDIPGYLWYGEKNTKGGLVMKEITAILALLMLLTSCGKNPENTGDFLVATFTETPQISEQTTNVPVTEPPTEPPTEAPAEPSAEPTEVQTNNVTDYEKAVTVYEYMQQNGSGSCVNYACQTYEKCHDIGLGCYIVWTDAGLYGHAANIVNVDGEWYVMDVQGGYFLDYNYCFSEVVDIDGNHIADSDIISSYSYSELH